MHVTSELLFGTILRWIALSPALHFTITKYVKNTNKIITVIIVFSITLFSSAMNAQSTQSYSAEAESHDLLSDDYLLIVDIYLGKYRLASDVFSYSSPEATIIPLQPLFDAIEFPIIVDPIANKAHGWFLNEKNIFDLNIASKKVIIDGESKSIPEHALILNDGIDIYADLSLLQQWFPFKTELEVGKLRVNIKSESPLPIEKQLEREQERKRLLVRNNKDNALLVADHYRLLGVPIVNVNLGGIIQDEETAEPSNASIVADTSYSIQSSTDILGMQSSLSFSKFSNNADSTKRLTLSRQPDLPNKDIIAGLEYVAFGDVFGVSDSLIFNGGEGLGGEFQFGDVKSQSDFGKRVIEGDATPGWEAELYRNGALVAFQIVSEDGRYRFDDVPVDYGENVFDTKLFGPQGQERTVRNTIQVGEQSLAKGKFYSRLNYINLNRSVFDDKNEFDSNGQPQPNEEKSYFSTQAGLTNWLSISAAFANHSNANSSNKISSNQYAQLGVVTSLPFASIAVESASLLGGGNANLFSAQTRVGNTSLSYLHKKYNDFESDRNAGNQIDQDIEMRLSGNVSPFNIRPISYQLTSNYLDNTNGSYRYSMDSRFGFQLYNGRLTIDSQLNDGDFAQRSLQGRFRYLRVAGSRTSIRASLEYRVEPDTLINGASTSITWRPTNKMRTQLSLNGDFSGNDNNNLGLSFSYLFDQLSLSADAIVQEGGGSSLSLNAEFSLGKENHNHLTLDNLPRANFGRVKAHAFLDNDYNGHFSEGDENLSGIRFDGRREWESRETDNDGIVYLNGLRPQTPTKIKIDIASLEDPYLRSNYNEKSFISHPGGLHSLEIPITTTTEVEGSLLLEKNGKTTPLPGIPVYLYAPCMEIEKTNCSDKKIASTVSEFDGFFVFESLIPSEYLLKINTEALNRFQIKAFTPFKFTVTAEEGVAYIDPIILTAGEGHDQKTSVNKTNNKYTLDKSSSTKKPIVVKEPNNLTATKTLALKSDKSKKTSKPIFKVQVAAYEGQLPPLYSSITDLTAEIGKDGLTRYVTQAYHSYSQAETRQRTLIDKGFNGAFVRVYSGSVTKPRKHDDKQTAKSRKINQITQPLPANKQSTQQKTKHTIPAKVVEEAPLQAIASKNSPSSTQKLTPTQDLNVSQKMPASKKIHSPKNKTMGNITLLILIGSLISVSLLAGWIIYRRK